MFLADRLHSRIHQCIRRQCVSDWYTQQRSALCHSSDWCLWPSHWSSTVWMRQPTLCTLQPTLQQVCYLLLSGIYMFKMWNNYESTM